MDVSPRIHLPESYLMRTGRWDLIPFERRQLLISVNGKTETLDLAHRLGGRSVKPMQPVLTHQKDGTPVMIATAGTMEVAEIEDFIYEYQDTNKPIDIAEYRERHGYGRKEDFFDNFAEAVQNRARKHMMNPRTDPAPIRFGIAKGLYNGY